jgi:Zn-dependent protease with chaperone function
MNILIGFVIVLCLVCSELQTPAAQTSVATDQLGFKLFFVGLISFLVPGLAFVQTLFVSRRLREHDVSGQQQASLLQRAFACHSAVWLSASLAIIWAIRWQDIVRGHWRLDRWPLLDEALILMPVLLSLVASWAIFYEIQRTIDGRSLNLFSIRELKRRLDFVSIRVRVYILMVLVPISLVVFWRDISPWIGLQDASVQIGIYVAGIACTMLGFPYLLMLIWKTDQVPAELKPDLLAIASRHQLRIRGIRVWKTGSQIINAFVAGFIPGHRFVFLSDRLLTEFPSHEIHAVMRHEAGHLRLCHLPIRFAFTVLPLIALSVDELNPFGLAKLLESTCMTLGWPEVVPSIFLCGVYLAYLILVLPWLSKNMEYEADIYSCQPSDPDFGIRADEMSDALLRLAAANPAQYSKQTLIHPSIESRLLLLRDLKLHPEKGIKFCVAFQRRRQIVIGFLVSICFVAAAGLLAGRI